MAKQIVAFLKDRNVILETVSYSPLPKDTKIKVHESTTVFLEQKGKRVGFWDPPLIGDKVESLSKIAPNAKKTFLFGKYKDMTIHYLNTSGFYINRKYEAKSAGGGTAYYANSIQCFITEIDLNKFFKWCKENNFKKNGNVWLSVGQAQNLIGNLLLEKGFQAVIGKRTFTGTHRLSSMNDYSLLKEVSDFANRNVERWGMKILISFQ